MAATTDVRERDKELSLMQHIGELRNRLMVAAIGLVIGTAIAFVKTTEIIKILLIPAGTTKLVTLSPTENFTTYLQVALLSGVALAMPVILYEIYAYIDPALYPSERRFIRLLGLPIIALFAAGMAFCYFVMLPRAMDFLVHFGSEVFDNQLRASEYLSFVTMFILGIGVMFEVPIIIYALVRVHILSRPWLAKQRRFVFLLAFVAGALITPTPDPFNQALVAIPMYLLFELGLFLARFAGAPRAAS
ncbi:MAG TPA: twin-arginine translocase subunit TatC [Candidatus Limnocylindria bacterium]|nr:twin-arginine translocase subunit TatC [Candidatus Limnocylindria bacterium]